MLSECCLAHALVPVVLKSSEVSRLWSAAAPRDPPLLPAPSKPPAPKPLESVTDATSSSVASEVKEHRRRQQHKRRMLKEAAAAELRSRETIKQLESAMVAAQVFQERDVQMQLREVEKNRVRKLDETFAAQARKQDEEDFEFDKQRVRMRKSQKIELRHHLDQQVMEADELKRKNLRELKMEKQENEVLQAKIEAENKDAEEKMKIRRRDLLAQDLLMMEEAERKRQEKRIHEKIEMKKCDLYSEFQHKIQERLHHMHKQQAKAEKSRIVPEMIMEGWQKKETKLNSWMVKIGTDKKDRESRLLADAERRLNDRKKRDIELGEHQKAAAYERQRKDKEEEAKEKAFDWRRQHKLTQDWKKLQQEERARQQASNREAFHQQILEERAAVEWEAAVDDAEEYDRRRRHKREDAQVLSHAQAALEQCKISGKPLRPLLKAIHNFKQRRGMLPNGPQRASVLSHLQVGLDPHRVAEQSHHYLHDN